MSIEKPEWLAQMEGILETLNEGVIIVDDCDRIIFANDVAKQMSGFADEDVIGRTRGHFFHDQDLAFVNAQVSRSRAEGRNRFEFYLPRRDGSRLPAIISSRMVEDADGREFAVLTLTDITEQKRAQEQLQAANERLRQRAEEIEHELSLASRVQQSLAPKAIQWGRVSVDTAYHPMRTVGGDFGLVAPVGTDGALNLLVCDVSGHGISSALVANRIYTETMSLLDRRAEVGDLLRQLNHFVVQQIRLPGFYFTMAVARLTRDGASMTYASGGHPPALWVTPAGEIRRLAAEGTILGLLEEAVPPNASQEISLSSGERVVLYTDGLLEVWNKAGEELGIAGLEEIVRRNAAKPLAEMKSGILNDVAAWRHGPATDDVSLVILELA
jgi:PAS domain S-box-containing protein